MSDKPTTPTKEELLTIPRWARVAFAARCARLAQPLFLEFWPTADRQSIAAIAEAIKVAEEAAANADAGGGAAAYAATVATFTAAAAIDAAATAAYAATYAIRAANADDADDAAYCAAEAAAHAADAAHASRTDYHLLVRYLRHDFARLCYYAKHEGWTDNTPVPPSFFGPVPDLFGLPGDQTPPASAGGPALTLTLDVPDGLTDEEVLEQVRRLALAADQRQRDLGGHGLEIREVRIEQEAGVPAEVR